MNKFKEIVDEANLIFNNEYNYIELFKKNNINFLKIECKNHGTFEKNIYNHIKNKQGCPQCSKPAKLTKELFIEKSISIHGKIYDYSNVIYNHGKDKVQIKCNKHGIFEMIPINHLKGQKCPTCSGRNKVTNELFIEKARKIHGDKYDYSQIEYKTAQTKIKIICKDHGEFIQMPLNHLKGNQCYKCSGIVKTNDDFIYKANKIHNNLYDYSKSKYSGTRKNIIITCKEHGDFIQKPNDHLSGNGCQKCCLGRFSKISIEWLDNIMKKENIFIQHAGNIGEKEIIIDNKKIRFDGFCEENNTVFEFYGDFFHGNPELYRENDINPINKKSYGELYINTIQREEHIKNVGYNLIKIWENDYCKNKKD
jgi:hypothetical protein